MSTKTFNPRCQGTPWVSAYLTVKDVALALDFYCRAFACVPRGELHFNEEGKAVHAEVNYQDSVIMFGLVGEYPYPIKTPKESGVSCPMSLYIYCEDVDQLHQKSVQAGAVSLMPPTDMFWGERVCHLEDLDGYVWSFAICLGKE